jgi:hypothetical protein
MRVLKLLATLALHGVASAGGGPETTVLVVNGRSALSRLVAHEYAALRDIPRSHVVYLDGVPHLGVIPLEVFRERIWGPIEAHLEAEGLQGSIDLVVYSVDFPYAVDFEDQGQEAGRHASLTGLTFLIRDVLEGRPFWGLATNPYYGVAGVGGAPRALTPAERELSQRAYAAVQANRWAAAAEAYEAFLATYAEHDASWYNYACCLARLGRKEAALEALARAVGSGYRDAAHAERDPDLHPLRPLKGFDDLLGRMKEGSPTFSAKPSRAYRAGEGGPLAVQLGFTGRFGNSVPEILAALRRSIGADGSRPSGTVYFCRNGDVRSTTREPFWPALAAALEQRGRKAELVDGVLPPAKDDVIGAVIGAAGFSWASSKSRIRPGAIVEHLTSFGAHFGTPDQTKLSELVRHGAAGTSGTVCEPFALHRKFPNPLVHAFYADGCSLAEAFFQSLSGPYQLMVAGDGLARPFARFEEVRIEAPPLPWSGTVTIGGGTELWVDGRRLPGLEIDTTAFDDGWHEVRVVKVSEDPVASRSYAKLAAVVSNRGRAVRVKGGPGGIEAHAPGAKGYRILGTDVTSADGRFAAPLGPGPVEVIVVAEFEDGAARSEPLPFAVPPPPEEPPTPLPAAAKPGLRATIFGKDGNERTGAVLPGDRHSGRPLAELLGVTAAQRIVLEGWFEAERDGFFELYVEARGKVSVNGAEGTFFPLPLAKGWHPLRVEFEPEGKPELALLLGGEQVMQPLHVRHGTFAALPRPPAAPKGLEALVDGERAQPGLAVPADGLILGFKAPARNVAAVTLFPGSDARALSAEWTVEATSGSKWLPVKDLRAVVLRPPAVAKDQPEVPVFVELSFAPVSLRRLRLRVKDEASLAEVEVLGALK